MRSYQNGQSVANSNQTKLRSNLSTSTRDDQSEGSMSSNANILSLECGIGYLMSAKQQKNSKKVIKSAVIWIQSQCILKAIPIETCLLAVSLLFCFSVKKKLQKFELEPLTICCLTLASKLHKGLLQSVQDGLALVNTSYPGSKLIDLEKQLLQCVDYNLHFETSYTIFSEQYSHSCSIYHPTCFLLEIVIAHDCRFLVDCKKMENLIVMARCLLEAQSQVELEVDEDEEIWGNVRQALDKNQREMLLSKYRTYFDVDEFVVKLRNKINL